jgi:WD40 repeat protein
MEQQVTTSSPIQCVKMNKRLILTGHTDKTLKLWDQKQMTVCMMALDHPDAVSSCLLDEHPATYCAGGTSQGSLLVWNLPSGKLRYRKSHTLRQSVAQLEANGSRIISLDATSIRVWSLASGMILNCSSLSPAR